MQSKILMVLCISLMPVVNKANNPENRIRSDTTDSGNKNLYKAVAFTSAYYAGSLFVLGKTWYKGRQRVPFHFYNDNRAYLQVDKLGHTFGAYVYSYIGYHFLLNSGVSQKESLIYGGTMGLALQIPIEIMDGIYEGYGFSWGDMIANSAGSALVIGQEMMFGEQLVKYKFSYWESPYAAKAHGYLGRTKLDRILNDYNGHTYWLSAPLELITSKKKIPNWINIAVGYSANGMYGEFENITNYNGFVIPETRRYRQFLISLDVDWSRIKTNSGFLTVVLKGLTFVKLPFPAIEFNSKNQFKGYWLYY